MREDTPQRPQDSPLAWCAPDAGIGGVAHPPMPEQDVGEKLNLAAVGKAVLAYLVAVVVDFLGARLGADDRL
jgi:hypothetical protein